MLDGGIPNAKSIQATTGWIIFLLSSCNGSFSIEMAFFHQVLDLFTDTVYLGWTAAPPDCIFGPQGVHCGIYASVSLQQAL